MSNAARIVDGIVVEVVELPFRVEIGEDGEPVTLPERLSVAEAFHPDAGFVAASADVITGMRFVGGVFLPPEPQPPPPLSVADYRLAIQAHIDGIVRARNYDSGLTCASYAVSTHPVWAAEAQAFVAWRDAVWGYAFGELAKVEAGERPQPEVAAFLLELPRLIWPAP